ncbi:MAG: FAD/NAD(P)-binding oxidoreductase [Coxiellaceae bacterium]|nr:FAD/NAD(P)-binding oxidoreductase [Coxiellaceae bacterium]
MRPMVVVGTGPAGGVLLSALASKGVPVIGIEMRERRLRPQVLSPLERSLIERVQEEAHVRLQLGEQQIKDLEKDIDAVIAAQLSVDGDGNPCVQAGKICLYKPYKVIGIDRTRSQVTIEHVTTSERLTLDFQHIFLCDGEARRMVGLLQDPSIVYRSRAYQPLHSSFALPLLETQYRRHDPYTGSLQFKGGMSPAELVDILEQIKYLDDPDDPDDPAKRILAWDRPYLPQAYTLPHGRRDTKHKINSEFLVKEPNPRRRRALVEQWGRKLLHLLSKYSKSDVAELFEFPDLVGAGEEILPAEISVLKVPADERKRAKVNLRLATTEVVLDRVVQPTIPMMADGSSHAILVGGAAASAWFVNANGAESAMEGALAAADCLDVATGIWDAVTYQQKLTALVERADKSSKWSLERRLDQVDEQMGWYVDYAMSQTEKPLLRIKGAHCRELLTILQDCIEKTEGKSALASVYRIVVSGMRKAVMEVRIGKKYLLQLRKMDVQLKNSITPSSTDDYIAEVKALRLECRKLIIKFITEYKVAEQALAVESEPEPAPAPAPAPAPVAPVLGVLGGGLFAEAQATRETGPADPFADVKAYVGLKKNGIA